MKEDGVHGEPNVANIDPQLAAHMSNLNCCFRISTYSIPNHRLYGDLHFLLQSHNYLFLISLCMMLYNWLHQFINIFFYHS